MYIQKSFKNRKEKRIWISSLKINCSMIDIYMLLFINEEDLTTFKKKVKSEANYFLMVFNCLVNSKNIRIKKINRLIKSGNDFLLT